MIKFILKLQKNPYPETYWSFNFIELKFTNTCQVWNFNFTLFNIFFQILKIKKRNETN